MFNKLKSSITVNSSLILNIYSNLHPPFIPFSPTIYPFSSTLFPFTHTIGLTPTYSLNLLVNALCLLYPTCLVTYLILLPPSNKYSFAFSILKLTWNSYIPIWKQFLNARFNVLSLTPTSSAILQIVIFV